jgi:hypothetical protein
LVIWENVSSSAGGRALSLHEAAALFYCLCLAGTNYWPQCNGETHAAALVHDERIGVGNVYHLFRLPEEMEQGIHQKLHDNGLVNTTMTIVARKDSSWTICTVTSQRQISRVLADTGWEENRIT